MKTVLLFLSAAISIVAAPGDDYKALTQGQPALKMGGTACGGSFGDTATGGRVVCFAPVDVPVWKKSATLAVSVE